MSKLTKQEINATLWHRGVLRHLCHDVQKQMYDIFYSSPERSNLVWLISRQVGKSFLLAILALEQALRKPHSIIKIATDTKIHIETIMEPIFREIFEKYHCPDDIKPEYKQAKQTFVFPNGSKIQLAGTDGKHYEKLRGQKADLVLIDEAGFCNDLNDVYYSVLFPTTTHTKGRSVMASTPSKEEDHDFVSFIEKAELEGFLTKKTIYDNPLLSAKDIQDIADKMGGVKSERFRREYLVELIKNSSLSVIPEFTEELATLITKEWPRPPFFDGYVSMDSAGKDLTALIFAYYDFRAGKLIIEDELPFDFNNQNNHIKLLVDQIKEKEETLWFNIMTNEFKPPLKRISDIDYILQQEISKQSNYKINFVASKKDDKDTAISNLRVLLANKKIIINPKCKTLLRHLKNVRWKSQNNKDTFARSPDNAHYDFVDSLIYLSRNIDFSRNPYPPGYELNLSVDSGFIANYDNLRKNDSIEIYKRLFGSKRR